MKQLLLLILPLILLLGGCSKNYEAALPSCKFISATPYGQDSLLLVGQVTNSGASPIEYAGFASSSQPNFDITTNQAGCAPSQTKFSTIISAYPDSTYYFKCYVANEYGYTVSNVYKYTVPLAKPDSAPCSLTMNMVNDNHNGWTMIYITSGGNASYGSYSVQASDASGQEVLNIYFNIVPTNGVYTTDGDIGDFIDNSYSRFAVYMQVGSFTQYPINTGGKVYIAQEKDGSTTVSFCGLTYTAFSTNFSLSGKINF